MKNQNKKGSVINKKRKHERVGDQGVLNAKRGILKLCGVLGKDYAAIKIISSWCI